MNQISLNMRIKSLLLRRPAKELTRLHSLVKTFSVPTQSFVPNIIHHAPNGLMCMHICGTTFGAGQKYLI